MGNGQTRRLQESEPRLGPAETETCLLLLAPYLDLSSALALTLVSSSLRSRLWPRLSFNGYYNNWTFLDACARSGYLNLMKFAHRSGSPIDKKMLELALKAGHKALASWLLSVLPKRAIPDYERRDFAFYAATCGHLEIFKTFFKPDPAHAWPATSLGALYAAAEGGQTSLALDLLVRVREYASRNNAAHVLTDAPAFGIAAQHGHLRSAIALCGSNPPSHDEIHTILISGFEGRYLDPVAFALDHGVALVATEVMYSKAIESLEILKCIDLKRPHFFAEKSTWKLFCKVAMQRPNIAVLAWLKEKGYKFRTRDAISMMAVSAFVRDYLPETSENFFICIKQIFEETKHKWTASELPTLTRFWLNHDRLEWLKNHIEITNENDFPFPDPQAHLEMYVRENPRIDPRVVSICLKTRCIVPSHDIWLFTIFAQNNVEILDLFLGEFGTPHMATELTELLLAEVATLFRQMWELTIACEKTPENSVKSNLRSTRPTYNGMLRFIFWTQKIGVKLSSNVYYEFLRVKNRFFISELEGAIPYLGLM